MTDIDIVIKEDWLTDYLYLESPKWLVEKLKIIKLPEYGSFHEIINNIKHVLNYRDYDKINYIFNENRPLDNWVWLYEKDYIKNESIIKKNKID